jgi:hypothetical protein
MAGLGLLGATITENPAPLDASPPPNAVSTFIETQTTPSDRLLIQSNDGYNHGGYETKIYPVVFGREVIGSNFQLVHDPPQFLSTMLLGREIGAWEPEALRDAIERWGVSKVLTVTNEAERLISRTFGEPGIAVGEHRAFEVSGPVSRFLRGDGRISVAVNRMQLSDVHDDAGLVVLRYRYHPAWRSSEGVVICSFSIPEDPAGFIALVDPPSSTTLTFDPWALFSAPWPEPSGPGDLACPTASAPHGGE